ncbi:MAG: hypothetical protein V3S69_07590 [Dehalococcoidales bacterium]
MKVLKAGHVYELDHLDGDKREVLHFVNREGDAQYHHPGTQTQEVLRALIDRTQHCDSCLRWAGNDDIIFHLRMALTLHEMRALQRGVEKGELRPESIPVGKNGHFVLGSFSDGFSITNLDAKGDLTPPK